MRLELFARLRKGEKHPFGRLAGGVALNCVANARLLNVHERHGDKLKIATLADFCGTRWQVNAIMIPVPGGNNTITIEFKRYGVGLAFTPTVLRDGLINLKIEPDRLAASNAELVKKIADHCARFDRRVATPAEARQILGLRAA